MTLPRAFTLVSLLTLPLCWTACSTTAPVSPAATASATSHATADSDATTTATFPREAVKRLRIGMSQEIVLQLIGPPPDVKPRRDSDQPGEVWTYTHWLDPLYREVAVEMDEITHPDPITGIERTILDPRPQLERITRQEFFRLTFNEHRQLVDLDYEVVRNREL